MELKGAIKLIGETQTVGANGFRKRQLVLSTHEQYPQSIPIDFVQDKVSLLDKYSVGEDVTISINIRGNEYNGKYFSNIQGWKIESNSTQAAQPQTYQAEPYNEQDDDKNPLPF